jgi:hypothetical protein
MALSLDFMTLYCSIDRVGLLLIAVRRLGAIYGDLCLLR